MTFDDDVKPIERAPVQYSSLPSGPKHGKARHGKAKTKKTGRPTRGRIWMRRAMVVGGLVVVLAVGAVAGDLWYINSLLKHTKDAALITASYNNTENVLLVGSTSRCIKGLNDPKYGLCSQGVNGVNSDVVMIVHLDKNTGGVSLLSIPRDLFVPNARIEGANKIDAALYQGPTQLTKAIEQDFGIPINHYVELNFLTFQSVVNTLGGIHMYFPMRVFDAYSGLYIKAPGCQWLNGERALQVVRARHLQIDFPGSSPYRENWPQEAQSDLARIRRNHEFLRVMATALKKQGLGNPITDQSLAASVAPNLTVDQNFGISHMIDLASTFSSVSIDNVKQLTMPVVLVNEPTSFQYKGGAYGDVEFPVQPGLQNTIANFLGLPANHNTFTGALLPSPTTVRVAVINGTGIPNQATTVAAQLGAHGFVITSKGDAVPTGPRSETVIYYNPSNPASFAAAQSVLEQTEGPAIMAKGPVTAGAQVTVLTGSDLSIKPVVHTPPAGHGSTTTTVPGHTSTTIPKNTPTTVIDPKGIKTDPLLGAPTPVAEPLQKWDPRSCTPTGGPGA